MSSFPRVTFDPAAMGGKACVRSLRVTVGTVVGLLAAGRTPEEILQAYPYLERDDVDQCLAYAAWRLESATLPFTRPLDEERRMRVEVERSRAMPSCGMRTCRVAAASVTVGEESGRCSRS